MEGAARDREVECTEQNSKGLSHPLSSRPGHQGLERAYQGSQEGDPLCFLASCT